MSRYGKPFGAAAAVAASLLALTAGAPPGARARSAGAGEKSTASAAAAYIHEHLTWRSETGDNPHQQDYGECDVYTSFPTLKTQQASQLFMDVRRSDEDVNVGNGTMHRTLIALTYSQGYAAKVGVDAQTNRGFAEVNRDGGPPAKTKVLPSYLQIRTGGGGSFFWNWQKPYIKVLISVMETDSYPDGRVEQKPQKPYWSSMPCGVTIGAGHSLVRAPQGSAEPQPQHTPRDLYRDGTDDGEASADWDLRSFFAAARARR